MSLWGKTRTEVAGAWRSLRYDLDRRTEPAAPSGPDVTCTGMSTFGPITPSELGTGYTDELPRRPRRMLAVTGFAALAAAGAMGSYFLVVNGLSSDESAVAVTQQVYPPADETTAPAAAAIGRAANRAHPSASRKATPAIAPTTVAAVAPQRRGQPVQVVAAPKPPPLKPPVPTPTFPTPGPSKSTSPAPPASPSPTPSDSPSSPVSPSPADIGPTERKKRHARDYQS
jgi:hypothetical protein